MTIPCYRIVKRERAGNAFDGEGARLYGGRWNSKGVRVVYTSSTLSLAILETLVHLDSHEVLARNYGVLVAEFPPAVREALSMADLMPGWNDDSPTGLTQKIGDRWVDEARSAVLAVPSVIAPDERNYLLNPLHPDFRRIIIHEPRDFIFSKRLLK